MRRVRRRFEAARPRRRSAGFTLLEVLLTAILSATLLAGLWSLFGTYLRLFESGQTRVERAQLARALTAQLSDDLHAVVIPRDSADASSATSATESADISGANSTSDAFAVPMAQSFSPAAQTGA